MSTDKIPVLLDTDIGSDIDDAVCLSYLLKQPRCEIVGITTVSGKPRERAALASAVCRAAGRKDIPIKSGIDIGITSGIVVQPNCPQETVLPRFDHQKPGDFAQNEAIEFMRKTIRARPNEITLLAIGRMTNVGLLFAVDPEIPSLLKDVVLMCGMYNFTAPVQDPCLVEWNALCDSVATRIVYRAPTKKLLGVGLDVTLQVQMPAKECISKFKKAGGPLSVVSAMTEVWASHANNVCFHDPLAAVSIFKPEVCTWREGLVTVEVTQTGLNGMTVFDGKNTPKPHTCASAVNADMFFKEYFGVTGG